MPKSKYSSAYKNARKRYMERVRYYRNLGYHFDDKSIAPLKSKPTKRDVDFLNRQTGEKILKKATSFETLEGEEISKKEAKQYRKEHKNKEIRLWKKREKEINDWRRGGDGVGRDYDEGVDGVIPQELEPPKPEDLVFDGIDFIDKRTGEIIEIPYHQYVPFIQNIQEIFETTFIDDEMYENAKYMFNQLVDKAENMFSLATAFEDLPSEALELLQEAVYYSEQKKYYRSIKLFNNLMAIFEHVSMRL